MNVLNCLMTEDFFQDKACSVFRYKKQLRVRDGVWINCTYYEGIEGFTPNTLYVSIKVKGLSKPQQFKFEDQSGYNYMVLKSLRGTLLKHI